jgi:hypothetical protein
MEQFTCTLTEAGLKIEGLPADVKKVVRISGERARSLAHYALHRSDLRFANECLLAIPKHNGDWLVQESLWRCGVIFYIKCFQNSVRTPLYSDKVYKGMAEEKQGILALSICETSILFTTLTSSRNLSLLLQSMTGRKDTR